MAFICRDQPFNRCVRQAMHNPAQNITHTFNYSEIHTKVEPPKKGHFGGNAFVPCMEVVHIWEVLNQTTYIKAHINHFSGILYRNIVRCADL